MVEIFREMRDEGHDFSVDDDDVPTSSDGPIFQLPLDVRQVGCIHASRDTKLVRAGVDKLRQEARVSGRVLGLDIEWEVSRAGAPPNPPATIQLATGKVVVIFHVLHGQRTPPDKLPQSLACLLKDAGLAKTGVGIKGDCTRLQRFFGVKVRNVVDLPRQALQRKVNVGRRRSLADLCLHLLGQRLQKDQHLRLSRWNVAELGEKQRGESEESCTPGIVFVSTLGAEMCAWEKAPSSSTERRHGVQQASSSPLDVLPVALLDGAGLGGSPTDGGGAASSTAGSSGAAVTGLARFVTPSEPFFAGKLAGVEALSESASSLAKNARVGKVGRTETEVERSETERGV
eukprot:jgi/Undpi1/9239/HiC_scaffold_26.g11697.m1